MKKIDLGFVVVDSGGSHNTGVEFLCSIVMCSCCSLKVWWSELVDGSEGTRLKVRGGAWSSASESDGQRRFFCRWWRSVLVVSSRHQSLLLLWFVDLLILLSVVCFKSLQPLLLLVCGFYPIVGLGFSSSIVVARC